MILSRKLMISLTAAVLGLGLGISTCGALLPDMSTSAYTGPDAQRHYQQRISEIKTQRPIRKGLLFVGDSLTEGCEWEALMPNTQTRNHGIGWDTSEGVVNRLPLILQNTPEHMLIMIGTNDLGYGRPHSEILANINTILNEVHAAQPNLRVTVQAVLPREAAMWGQINGFNRSLGTMIRAKRDSRVAYANHAPAFMSRRQSLNPRLTYDGVHLNPQGCQIWARQIRTGP